LLLEPHQSYLRNAQTISFVALAGGA